ncbi:flippase [Croceicoccus pelagius]|uniref:O-unit flippase n=1 Tax=Croceicoccus pelagius TaxID=1703341 RepID=A0A916Y4T9_9SPHN|nr:flippase [Croceicoccus pelagius]GGD30924.1 O-unit flippase [Croceicoccus pelagius]
MERYFTRIGWLGTEQVLRILAGLLFVAVAARYLGPARFGTMTYALTIASLASQVVRYGQDNLVIKDIVRNRSEAASTVATAFLIRLALWVLACGAMIAFLHFVPPPGPLGPLAVAGMCVLVLAVPFESQFAAARAFDLFRNVSIGRSIVVVLAALVAVAFVLLSMDVDAFVMLRGFETLVYGLVSLAVFISVGKERGTVRLTGGRFVRMVRLGFPIMLSQLAVLAYLTIDQVMLGLMAGSHELGLYGVAVKIAMLGAFLPRLLQSVTYPTLVEREGEGAALMGALSRYFDYFAATGWLVAIGTAIGATLFLVPLFGASYEEALPVCLVLLLAQPLFALTTAYKSCLSASSRFWPMTVISGAAAATNVVLNLVLIPRFGGMGAAVATIAALFVASIVSASLRRDDRAMAAMMVRSLEPFGALGRTFRQVMPLVAARMGRKA